MKTLPFSDASDSEVQSLLSEYQIGLTVDEARKVSTLLGRDPTVVEAVIWGIQGSEHCSYKSSRRFLKQFTTNGPHIILGPVEDSGVVAITDEPNGKRWGFVVTHESHNHPSQIVPFEGAATGVGGTVRDVLCMGARVIGCMDMLRLGDLQSAETRTIAKEVVRGIGGYGNPLGVPNLGGDTVFDATYNGNCLVNAIALGIVREDEIIHSYAPEEAGEIGYDIILVGKPTDRSGFGGAAFASANMEEEKREQNTGAVQEPNPFLERHLLASSYALFDWLAAEGKLDKVSYKDLGAGGVICASVEQVADVGFGATIDLNAVHTAMDGLPAEVIACAETQERLCWTCHPDLTQHILDHYNNDWDLPSVAENARASVVGKVTRDDTYTVQFNGEVVCQAKATDITSGLQYERPVTEVAYNGTEPDQETITSHAIEDIFHAMLRHPNAASKATIFKHYDKTVIGNSILEPGEADAGVIAPLQDLESYVHVGTHPDWNVDEEDTWKGVAIAGDGNGRFGRISPYWQGANAVIEAMRNVAAVGALPRAITDCLNYGNPEIPEHLWAFAEGVRGIAEASAQVCIHGNPVPVISGNVSLYNSHPDGSAIDPTAIVSCIGILPDARKAVSMQLKQKESLIYFIGSRRNECGGSLLYEILETMTQSEKDSVLGANVPQPIFSDVADEIHSIFAMIQDGGVRACHDISKGGLLLALFEMTVPQRKMGGDIGLSIDISDITGNLSDHATLFSESGGFIIEIDPEYADSIENSAKEHNVPCTHIGKTTEAAELKIVRNDIPLYCSNLSNIHQIWASSLSEALSH